VNVTFFVAGTPRPGGSKRVGRGRTAGGFTKIVEDGKYTAAWREAVGWAGREAMRGVAPFAGPLHVTFHFYLPLPKKHAKKWPPPWPTGAPDTTKLVRSTEDALKEICWWDDAQIVQQSADKQYADPSRYGSELGCRVTIIALEVP
jgi:Holliday junction resolvase RusA-like endonuclease